MIVKCEQCQTRFKIPDEKVTEKGVKVRCTKCQHTFRVSKASAGAAAPAPARAAAPEADPFAAFGSGGAESRGEPPKMGDFGLGLSLPSRPAPQSSASDIDDHDDVPTRAVTMSASLLARSAAPAPSAPRPKASAPTAPAPAPFDFSSLGPSSAPGPAPAPGENPFDFSSLGPAPQATPRPSAPSTATTAPFDLFGSAGAAPAPGARFDPFAPMPASGPFNMAPAASPAAADDLLGLLPPPPAGKPAVAPKAPEPAVPAFSGEISLDALDIPGPPPPAAARQTPPPEAPLSGSDDLELDLGAGTLPGAPPTSPPVAKASAPKAPPAAAKKASAPPKKEAPPAEKKPDVPVSSLLEDIPVADSTLPQGQLPAPPPTSLLGDDEFGMIPSASDRDSLFDMPANEPSTLRETLDEPPGPRRSAPGATVPVAKLALKRVTAESFLSPEEELAQAHRKRVARLLVNIGFSVILVIMIGLVSAVYLNDGKLDAGAFSFERMKAALTAPKDFVSVDVSNGLYETRAERSVFFVRGDVLNLSTSSQRLKVRAELLDGDRLVTASEAIAGGAPSPEDLFAVTSANDLAQLTEKLSKAAPPVASKGRSEFLVAFFEYPPDLKAFRVKLLVTPDENKAAEEEKPAPTEEKKPPPTAP